MERRVGLLALVGTLLACLAWGSLPRSTGPSSIDLNDARELGAFNVKDSRAKVDRVVNGPESTANGSVGEKALRFEYSLPEGTAAGIFSKGFPEGLEPGRLDVVRFSVRASKPEQTLDISASMEIRGSVGRERIPLPILDNDDQTPQVVAIDWAKLGKVEQVDIAVVPEASRAPVSGTISVVVRFEEVPWLTKAAMLPTSRVSAVIGLALLVGLAAIPMVGWRRAAGFGGPGRDLVQGVGSALILALGVASFDLGERSGLDSGWWCLALALGGAIVAEWWSFGIIGRHLTSAEAVGHSLAVGLLAASSSPMGLLQAPANWSEAMLLSQTSASLLTVVYLTANAWRLSSAGKPLDLVTGTLIVATPYVFGSLVLLSVGGLMGQLGTWLVVGPHLTEIREEIGRTVVLFGFNEAIVLALGMATKRRWPRAIQIHGVMLVAASLAAALGIRVADFGSSPTVLNWPGWSRPLVVVASTMVSQAGLWAEVYLITGLLLDAIRGTTPSAASTCRYFSQGLIKGGIFAGMYMAILQGLGLLLETPGVVATLERFPILPLVPFGALSFPLVKTIFETFDGSQAFFRRVAKSYWTPILYLRGAILGLGIGLALMVALPERSMLIRVGFGFVFGIAAFAGVNAVVDRFERSKGHGQVQSWRVYFVQGILGGFIGTALGFYFDAVQVGVVVAKFYEYLAIGSEGRSFGVTPFVSKWGFINLGTRMGGSKLLFDEALSGVIEWSIPAWLFAINNRFMTAFFRKEMAPIRGLFTRDGMAQLTENMIQVFRWGLWMSPIVKSFLRPMGEPTWYNQDGAIRTTFAIFHGATESRAAFRAWSFDVFVAVLAYDLVRVLIWVDHMGLRVATLVNLSFLGMDKLDEKFARFLRPASTARCIPEGVKRFTTWAPLLIPYYIPRGQNWNRAWSSAEKIRAANPGGLTGAVLGLPADRQLLVMLGFITVSTGAFSLKRWLSSRLGRSSPASWTLRNPEYDVELKSTGEFISRVLAPGFDLTRRSYDGLDPAGRALFLVDASGTIPMAWPILGNFPGGEASRFGRSGDALIIERQGQGGLAARVAITLPDPGETVELWTITLENPTDSTRTVKLIPYLEWVLNQPGADRGHTQYARLFPEMEYAPGLHAVLAWDKHSKAMGILASDLEPDGFLTSRVDFIGRARSLRNPRGLETLAFSQAGETNAHPTFDPIGSLKLSLTLGPRTSKTVRLLIGHATGKAEAIELVAKHLAIPRASSVDPARKRKDRHAIGHGEIPQETPQPYSDFSDDGRTLHVLTPFTPRPYDHAMSNALGHVVTVTNRGMQTTSSGNSQQNRITPDWADTVTRELPSEAFYLLDPATYEWFSPTYQPLNDPESEHDCSFSVDGTATYRMTRGAIETELTVFVPPDEPVGVYLLTVRNRSRQPRHLRLAAYFQIVLASQPEAAGPLQVRLDSTLGALFFENPRNNYRRGPAFAAMSIEPDHIETDRGQFFGPARDVSRPSLVQSGSVDEDAVADGRPIAGFLGTLQIPSDGEETVVILLGQADNRTRAEAVIRRYLDLNNARLGLESTRSWWLNLMDTVRVETGSVEFDRYLDWLKYQALAERIWARRGFYQASGAFGFRDQLQDSVNLIWMDPILARNQIMLHGSQQFLEGDVVHWFHRLQDGRTGFVARTHASDNLLWLAWAVVEYVEATGDEYLLDEQTSYLASELPFEPLPSGKHGMGFDPLRSTREDTIYRHCLRSIDLVLDRRMGVHGLPLIGTGDWNDGLDEIGSQGRGESIWLGFFLHYILQRMAGVVGKKEGPAREDHYLTRLRELGEALESTWRDDRYLRAIHDDGTEIGVKGSGVWEIDTLTAAWAVMSGINTRRGKIVFDTALSVLEKETTILLGWPPLREDTTPYLGRSSWYPEGVRENGMYCHGVQWLVGAARILSDQFAREGKPEEARHYAEAAHRLWLKISPIAHVEGPEIETYGGQPNKQAADMVTTFDPGRMIWHGYTGAAAWMFRQALEGVLGLRLVDGAMTHPPEGSPTACFGTVRVTRDLTKSPLPGADKTSAGGQNVRFELESDPTSPTEEERR